MPVTFQPASKPMAPVVYGLIRQLGHEPPYDNFLLEFEDKLQTPGSELWVAVSEEGRVIAFAEMAYSRYLHKAQPWAKLVSFCVDSEYRGRGLGSEMLHFLEGCSRARSCECLELISNHRRVDAHRFYERHGYEEYKKMFIKRFA